MTRSARLRYLVGLSLAAWLLVLAPASAYVDPGSTSIVFQAIVAGVAAAGLTFKMWWHRLVNLLRPGRGTGPADGDPGDGAAASDPASDAAPTGTPSEPR